MLPTPDGLGFCSLGGFLSHTLGGNFHRNFFRSRSQRRNLVQRVSERGNSVTSFCSGFSCHSLGGAAALLLGLLS